MRAWLAAKQYNSQSLPRPEDTPRVCIPGFSATRVLIFGSGPAVGWGVTSHEIALPGALARSLASRSGRGVDVEVVADMRFTVRNALCVLRGLDLEAYDVIVLVLGANDAMRQTPVAQWRRHLAAIFAYLDTQASDRARIFLAGIPPIRAVPGFVGKFGNAATERGSKLNHETKKQCSSIERAAFIPLPLAEKRSTMRFGDGRTYRAWANVMAEVIAPAMLRARWGLGDGEAVDADAGLEGVPAHEVDLGR